jgi:curved DNA-binding protein CbpA
MTHYEVLQVSPQASVDVINASWKALVRKNHPDVNKTAGAKKLMLLLNEAHEVLSNSEKRAQYDFALSGGFSGNDFEPDVDTNGHSKARRRKSPGGAYESAYKNAYERENPAPVLMRDPNVLMKEFIQGVAETGNLAIESFLDAATELTLAKLHEMSPPLAALMREQLKKR